MALEVENNGLIDVVLDALINVVLDVVFNCLFLISITATIA